MDEERYEINSLLGKGRTGGVYAAEDTQMSRTVAVRRFYSAGGDTSSADWEEEFLTIAQKLGNLQDSNLLTVLDAGVDEDGAFLVSQLLEGQRLSDVVVQAPFEEHEAHEMASQLLDALTYSHEAGFIHGALTAGSIMLTSRARGGYRYIIMDMGLSRLAPLIQGADSSYAMMADPALLAPEIFDGEPATAVSDYYMLGHLVYLSLIGGHPFAFKPIDEVKDLHKSGAFPPISNYREDITPAFVDWLKSLTHYDISKRPQSAAEALKTLPKLPPKKSTVAVSATPPAPQPSAQVQVPLPPAANRSAPVVASPSINTLSAPQAKGKKKLILAIILPLLLIAGVSIAYIEPQDSNAETFYQEEAEKTETKPINAKLKSSKIISFDIISIEGMHPTKGHKDRKVFSDGKLDWVVFKAPLSDWDKFSLAKSNFIQKPSLIGKALDSKKPAGNLTFLVRKGTKINPNLYAESSDIGDGWRIKISNKQAKTTLELILHFTSWNCDAKLRILSADGTTELIPAYDYKSDSENTSFRTTIMLDKELLDDHRSFLLELTTTEAKPGNPSGLTLSALIVK